MQEQNSRNLNDTCPSTPRPRLVLDNMWYSIVYSIYIYIYIYILCIVAQYINLVPRYKKMLTQIEQSNFRMFYHP